MLVLGKARYNNNANQEAARRNGSERASAFHAFHQRWSGVVAVAAQRALAATLAGLPNAGQDDLDGAAPPFPEVLAVASHGVAGCRCGPADKPRRGTAWFRRRMGC